MVHKNWSDQSTKKAIKSSLLDNDNEKQNTAAAYVVNDNDIPITFAVASKMCVKAQCIWKNLKQEEWLENIASWKEIGNTTAMHYHAKIEKEYSILYLCNSHWKATQLATDNFPNWIKSKFALGVSKKRCLVPKETLLPVVIKHPQSLSPLPDPPFDTNILGIHSTKITTITNPL